MQVDSNGNIYLANGDVVQVRFRTIDTFRLPRSKLTYIACTDLPQGWRPSGWGFHWFQCRKHGICWRRKFSHSGEYDDFPCKDLREERNIHDIVDGL